MNEQRSVDKILSARARYHRPAQNAGASFTGSGAPPSAISGLERFKPLRASDLLHPSRRTSSQLRTGGGFTLRPDQFQHALSLKSDLSDSAQQQWLAGYGSGLAASADEALSIARDPAGNLYVAGFSDSSFTGNDIVTIKFNSGGVRQWTARYDGPAQGDDRPSRIALDSAGNVYVAGYSEGIGTGYDYVTIKYNPNGVRQWASRYNAPGNGDDYATAIATDGAGNIYVTGYSAGPGTGYDYATVRYNSSGVEQAVFRYNGTGNGNDFAVAIAIDKSNSACVTGYTTSAGSGTDITTVKYDASGNQRWLVSYNGPGNGNDLAAGLAIDNSANVYVTGTARGLGTGNDIATIKYDSSGSLKWVSTYNGPSNGDDRASAIAVDGTGNVYVAGSSSGIGTGFDFVTLRYTTGGLQLWASRYDDIFGGDDLASAIALDPAGYVYVTGSSPDETTLFSNQVTVMYSSAGIQRWVARYKTGQSNDTYPTAIVNDGSGNAIVAGYSDLEEGDDYDYSVVCYGSTGIQVWEARYNGPGISDDAAAGVVADKAGNITAAGYSRSSVSGYDFLTVRYNSSGVLQWTARYDGPSSGDDIVSALAADQAGNVYVTGYSYDSSGTTSEYVTVKYDPAGHQQWAARYSGLLESTNFAFAIAVNNAGAVFVTGTSGDSSGSAYDYLTIKYNGSGVEQWNARYNGSDNGGDFAVAVATDSAGNVYVTGASDESANKGYDYATVKYNGNGVRLWSARYDGPASDDDNATAIAVDASGNVDVTGSSPGVSGTSDYATVQYNPGGTQQWVQRYNGSANDDDAPTAIRVDGRGNVYVTGYSTNTGAGYDYATIKYTSHGSQRWAAIYNGPEGGSDQASGIAVDQYGGVYVTGSSDGTGTSHDYATVKYDSAGSQQWSLRFNGISSASDDAMGIALDAAGAIIITGSSGFGLPGDPSGGSTFATVKYRQVLPQFVVSRTSMNFGSVHIGCRSADTLEVFNPGLAPLAITSVQSDNAMFTVDPASVTIDPAAGAVFEVTFTPVRGSPQSGHLIFTHNAGGSPDTVVVSGTSSDTGTGLTIPVSAGTGWQLISLPVGVTCPYVLDRLYAYESGYTKKDTMANGVGYWKKLDQPNLSFTGFAISQDTVSAAGGWNIIGSISKPVSPASIATIPPGIITSPFFGYAGSYAIADTILPGHGYWVKTSKSGSLVFQSPLSDSPKRSTREFLQNLERMRFAGADGATQTLYFGLAGDAIAHTDDFELPPLPPDGSFDARFSTGSMAALLGRGESRVVPIRLSSGKFPLTFVCVRSGENPDAWLEAGDRKIPLRGNVNVEIGKQDMPLALKLRGVLAVPSEFSLEQNYPNPFNPVTVIGYELPVRSRVRLEIYDVLGRNVKTLVDGIEDAGLRSERWEALDETGAAVSSGIYFCRMQATSVSGPVLQFTRVNPMVLIR